MLEDELSSPPDALPTNPPVQTVAQSLPFGALSWQNFERLCFRVARTGADTVHCARYGKEGDGQDGIDIFVRRESDRYDVWQVKRHKRFSAKDIRSAVDKFFEGKWSSQSDLFRLAVQTSLSGTRVQDEIEKQAMRLRGLNITFLASGEEELSEELRAHPQLVREFFGRYWADAFFGPGHDDGAAADTALAGAFGAERLAQTLATLTGFNLDRLESAGLYRPDRTITRSGFDQAFGDFLAASEPIMPLIDRSGVGKTSMLALTAAKNEEQPLRLMLRGADIVPGQEGLVGLIAALAQQRLSVAPTEEGGFVDAIRHLPERLDQPLLILLDGLNESAITIDVLRTHWLPPVLEWLSRGPVKLVLSCRPEYWQAIRDAWPVSLLHPAPPKPEKLKEADKTDEDDETGKREPLIVAPQPSALRETRMGDFTSDEAEAAIAAYGLQDSLRPEDATHPFILAVADATESYADLPRVLMRLIERKTLKALGRCGNPTAYPRVSRAVRALAAEMFERNVQVVDSEGVEVIFAGDLAVLDALTEEHLLLQDSQGYRFQFDQVRELLQSMDLTARDILAEITLLPPIPDRHWLYSIVGRFPVEIVLFNIRNRRLRSIKAHRPRLSASLASFVTLGLLGEGAADVGEIFETLFKATAPDRDDRGAAWAAETIQLVFDRMSGDALADPILNEWLERFVRRPDDYLLSMRNDEILRSASRALMRSQLSISERLALIPSFIVEDTHAWSGRRLRNTAFWERYGQTGRDYTLAGQHAKSAAAGLLEKLAAADSALVVSALLGWLADPGPSRERPNSISRPSLGNAAAECLYYLRSGQSNLICRTVLRLESDEAGHLREAMAVAETDSTVPACLAAFPGASVELFERIMGTLWICGRQAMSDQSRSALIEFAQRAIEDPKSPAHFWGARIILQQFDRYVSLYAMYPDRLWPVEPVQRLVPSLQPAFDILLAAIGSGKADMEEDYEALIRHAYDQMIDELRGAISADFKRHPLMLPALLSHLSAPELRSGRRTIEDYARLVELLAHLRQTGGEQAATSIGWFAVCSTTQVGYNTDYYFSAEDVEALGIVDLAVSAIDAGGDGLFQNCRGMRLPPAGPIQDRIVEALARSSISADDAGAMVGTMCRRGHEPEDGWFAALFSLRTDDRAAAWDAAVLDFLTIGSTENRKLLQTCIDFWKQSEREKLPALTREYFDWLDVGMDPAEAVRALFATPYYKKLLLAKRKKHASS